MPSSLTPLQTKPSVNPSSVESLVTGHLPELCRAFEQATGWPLRYVPATEPADSEGPFVDDPGCAWWYAVSACDSVLGYLRMDLPGPSEEVADLHALCEQWTIEKIKKDHPEWVVADGICPKCLEFYMKL